MLRILVIIIVLYLVLRIALRLLLTESPSQRRSRVNDGVRTKAAYRNRSESQTQNSASSRFDDIEDAEFEDLPREPK